jgi:orotate phosphoribosyltransferase-like protein
MMAQKSKKTDELVAQAVAARNDGKTFEEIAGPMGVSAETVRTWLGLRIRRDGRNGQVPFRPSDVLPNVPEDTRSIGARLCGDPLPGRSALDKRNSP